MNDAGWRLPGGGRIDRDDLRRFRFDGRELAGLGGDTVASALLAHGVHLAGRSFKLHRPRGIFSAGVEEPNALVTLRGDGRREPNIQATLAEVCDGLVATSQNRWPALGLDVMAINNVLARFLPAGFYYKTFMGPARGSWMWYEPAIRRAAGLGRATTVADPDRYECRHDFCDVLVVGAGPAGLAAALAAGRAGSRVMLVDQHATPGGRLLDEAADGAAERWRLTLLEELATRDNVRLMPRTTAFGLYDGNVVGALERVSDHRSVPADGEARQRYRVLHPRRVVLATGATERPLLFANNDRPGIMLAGAVRRYINHFAVLPGRQAVVHANNDSAYAAALDLQAAGAAVAVVDCRPEVDSAIVRQARDRGIQVHFGSVIRTVDGARRVRAARITGAGGDRNLPCDLVCVSGGWTPNVHLASHRGHRPRFDEVIGAFVADDLPPGVSAAGGLAGVLDAAEAAAGGWRAGIQAAGGGDAGELPAGLDMEPVSGHVSANAMDATGHARGKVFVDLQNDVTTADIDLAWREGFRSVEHLKRYTTLGMGTDQGRTSNINAMKRMATLCGQDVSATGTTTFRPPFTPVALGALAGRRVATHFRPQRRTPMHDLHAANGAEFLCAGPWQRVWYFRGHGADVAAAYVHEMQAVRSGVGMVDVSTLGKIDIQGPDAAAFLDRVYVNGWRKLAVGRCRYGVMLRDDGLALDDGTTSRLDEHHYFMTTTTGEAAVVMSWLEFLLETAWPDLQVMVTSVTDQWAGVAVAGPDSRRVLEQALPGAVLADDELTPMGVREDTCSDGLPIRILRVSFSGERAYEVYVPAGYGPDLWQRIAAAGAPFDITPYGVEALGALRIEKGHPVAPEIDGRTTLEDLGLGRMARDQKAFVGQVLRRRPALIAADRPRLVGLRAIDPRGRLRPGCLLTEEDQPLTGHGLGYISSATWSPSLDTWIALAFIAGGADRRGNTVLAVSPVHGESVRVEVVSPVFLDPEGTRIHA